MSKINLEVLNYLIIKFMRNKAILWHQNKIYQWQLHKSPSRPSRIDIKIYENFLRKLKNFKKVLILGSTPELRDLAHKYNKQVVIIDISLIMMQAMSELMRYKSKIEKEIWVKANWLDNILAENYFDIVIGDLVVENIPFKLQGKFCQKISSLLKREGYFIVREVFLSDKNLSFDQIIEKYLQLEDITLRGKNLIGEFITDLMWCTARDHPPYVWNTIKAINFFKKYIKKEKSHKRKEKLKRILDDTCCLYGQEKIWWVPPKKTYENNFKKYFKIISAMNANDYYAGDYTSIFLLKNK